MKTKKIVSLVLAALMLVSVATMFVACDNNSGNDNAKITVSVELYTTESDGTETVFMASTALEMTKEEGKDITVNDALVALITERGGTFTALTDGSVDTITFNDEKLATSSKVVSSDEAGSTYANTHFVWTVNGVTPDKGTSTTYVVNDGDKIVYKLVTTEQYVAK